MLAGQLAAGGALMNTTEVENFPGFPEGIQGPELMDNMREQAEKFGADIRYEDVVAVNLEGDVKAVATEDEVFYARAVILATGSEYRHMNVPGEESSPAAASPTARPATASSSRIVAWPSSAAATPRWRRRPS